MNTPKIIDTSNWESKDEWDRTISNQEKKNALIQEAIDIGAINHIDEVNGSWHVLDKFIYYPRANKWRLKGKGQYFTDHRFSKFWEVIHSDDLEEQMEKRLKARKKAAERPKKYAKTEEGLVKAVVTCYQKHGMEPEAIVSWLVSKDWDVNSKKVNEILAETPTEIKYR